MNSPRSSVFFYQFLGAHSLLIGLLPFYLPVYLWQHGLALPGLCLFIGLSGLGFVAALPLWQHLWQRWQTRHIIAVTFFCELLLVMLTGVFTLIPGAALFVSGGESTPISLPSTLIAAATLGVANGLYNAFFWTTQRSLFLQQLAGNDAGKQYGNFQIFVAAFLKLGILLGGWLLNIGGFIGLLALSAGVGFAANTYLYRQPIATTLPLKQRVNLYQSLTFRDNQGSRPTFFIDGLFLYLESHFWTLTLFFVVGEDYSRLGLAFVVLALVFAVLFYLIKNRIDHLPNNQVYRFAVYLYAFSWLLRFSLDSETSNASLWALLILITFCSSFFRLALNKRFFDIARQQGNINYLLIKSYSSQCLLGGVFLITGSILLLTPLSDQSILQWTYLPAAALALVYTRYRNIQ